jgi:hypothetical protein
MSTPDDKTNAISADERGAAAEAGSPNREKDQDKGSGGPIILFFILGLAASLILGWIVFPKLLYSQKKQPIDFNHVLHMEQVDNGCESCHYFREDGTYAGVPQLAACIDCHEEVMGESENEAKFVEEYVAQNKEVPWLIYSRQPDCVYFSHAAHVIKAQMNCETCHGHIGESESLKVYEENRITGYSRDIWGRNMSGFKRNTYDRMKMDDCAECHVKENVKQNSVQTLKGGCFVCHK